MMVRLAGVTVLLGVGMIVGGTACGNGGTPGTGGSGGQAQSTPIVLPPAPGQTACQSGSTCSDQAAVDAYGTCIVSTCDAQYKQCFGADYTSGTYGGACKALMDCASKCQSCDQACIKACTDADFVSACKDCISGPIFTCAVDAITAGTCTLPCGPSTTGGVCDTLEACCNGMTGADKASCLSSYSMVKVGGDTACSAVLGGYTAAGVCGAGSSSSSSSSGSSSSSSSSGSSSSASSSSSSSSGGNGPSCTLPPGTNSCVAGSASGLCQSFSPPYTAAIVMQACPSPNVYLAGPCPTASAAAYCVYPDGHSAFFSSSLPQVSLDALKMSCGMAMGSWCLP